MGQRRQRPDRVEEQRTCDQLAQLRPGTGAAWRAGAQRWSGGPPSATVKKTLHPGVAATLIIDTATSLDDRPAGEAKSRATAHGWLTACSSTKQPAEASDHEPMTHRVLAHRLPRRTAAGSRGRRPWFQCPTAGCLRRAAGDHRPGDPGLTYRLPTGVRHGPAHGAWSRVNSPPVRANGRPSTMSQACSTCVPARRRAAARTPPRRAPASGRKIGDDSRRAEPAAFGRRRRPAMIRPWRAAISA